MSFKSSGKKEQEKKKSKSNLIKVGALWENQSGNGYSGQLDQKELEKALEKYGESARICLFENGYKEEDKHPDLVLYVGKGRERVKSKSKDKPKKSRDPGEDDDSDEDDSDSDDAPIE